jgi:hypothetical protein
MEHELNELIERTGFAADVALLRFLRKTHLRRSSLVVQRGQEIARHYTLPWLPVFQSISEGERMVIIRHRHPSHTSLKLFGLVWLGLVWFGLVWLGLAWLGLAWLGSHANLQYG